MLICAIQIINIIIIIIIFIIIIIINLGVKLHIMIGFTFLKTDRAEIWVYVITFPGTVSKYFIGTRSVSVRYS